MNVSLEIDELVLHGFPAEARYRVAEALEQELTDLFAVQGGAPRGTGESCDLDALPPLEVVLAPGATPQHVGRLLGRELFRALEQSR